METNYSKELEMYRRKNIDKNQVEGSELYKDPMTSEKIVKKKVIINEPDDDDDHKLKKNNQNTFVMLSKEERKLLNLVDEGDLEEVQYYIQEHPNMDINGVNYQGQSALSIAIENQNTELVEYFLSLENIRFGDALLRSIKEGNLYVVEILLEAIDKRKQSGIVEQKIESAEFPNHMTPLLLACLEDHFEIVRFLLMRGHDLKLPSAKAYKESEYSEYGEVLELSRERIDCYKALASSSYMILSSDDPILTSFKMAHEAEKMSLKDPIYKDDYEEISTSCRKFACAFLEQCRSSEEVAVILSQEHEKEFGPGAGADFPRLILALDMDMKEFVTNSNCQQVIQNIWTKHHPNVMWYSALEKFMYFLPQLLLLPFIYLIYIFVPCASFLVYWEAPMNKFLGHLASYIVFLCLLFVSVLRGGEQVDSRVPDLNGGIDICIWLWVAGMIYDQIIVTIYGGIKMYKKHWWTIYDFIMLVCFIVSFTSRLASFIKAEREGYAYKTLQRNFWPFNDPQLVSEAFYCFATILAFGRILYYMQGSQIVGPMLLSLSKMTLDVLRILTLFFVLFFGFATAMTRLYSYYADSVQIDTSKDNKKKEQPDAFETFSDSFNTLFWNLFGYGEPGFADVVVANNCTKISINKYNCTDIIDHKLTQGSGYFMYGLYHLIAVVTLLNMLIAMMSNSLNKIEENEDREWKFLRSRLWTSYLIIPFLPSPLNLIPTPYGIYKQCLWFVQFCCRGNDQDGNKARYSRERGFYFESAIEQADLHEIKKQYKILIDKIIKRYWATIGTVKEDDTLTAENLEQTKIDILKEIQKLQMKSRMNSRINSRINSRLPTPRMSPTQARKSQEIKHQSLTVNFSP